MTKNPFKFIGHLFMYLAYKSDCIRMYNLYLTAKEKGMYCEGINYHTGIAKFDPNSSPQEEPKCKSFKEVMTALNRM